MSIVAPPVEQLNSMEEDTQNVQPGQPAIYHATVRDIPVDDRPRERLQKKVLRRLPPPICWRLFCARALCATTRKQAPGPVGQPSTPPGQLNQYGTSSNPLFPFQPGGPGE